VSHHRGMRRLVVAAMLVLGVGLGLSACGGGDTQGRKEPDVQDLQSKVSSLRLEVESLRSEVQSLRQEVASATTTTSVPDGTTGTTAPRSTTSTTRA
jgi:outer membrane murein-binding lipoprotein Lpp